MLSHRGDAIVAERPTYFLASNVFERAGLETLGVPTDDSGLDTAALAAMLADLEASGQRLGGGRTAGVASRTTTFIC
jgi:DNA-binding transcriptional MocR family regulator